MIAINIASDISKKARVKHSSLFVRSVGDHEKSFLTCFDSYGIIKRLYGHHWQRGKISLSVCPWKAFPA
jgi:hypothetical protein